MSQTLTFDLAQKSLNILERPKNCAMAGPTQPRNCSTTARSLISLLTASGVPYKNRLIAASSSRNS